MSTHMKEMKEIVKDSEEMVKQCLPKGAMGKLLAFLSAAEHTKRLRDQRQKIESVAHKLVMAMALDNNAAVTEVQEELKRLREDAERRENVYEKMQKANLGSPDVYDDDGGRLMMEEGFKNLRAELAEALGISEEALGDEARRLRADLDRHEEWLEEHERKIAQNEMKIARVDETIGRNASNLADLKKRISRSRRSSPSSGTCSWACRCRWSSQASFKIALATLSACVASGPVAGERAGGVEVVEGWLARSLRSCATLHASGAVPCRPAFVAGGLGHLQTARPSLPCRRAHGAV